MVALSTVASEGVSLSIPEDFEVPMAHSSPALRGQFEQEVASQIRSFKVNGVSYPDASLHIPVSFVASSQSRFYAFGHYVNRVRHRTSEYGCQPDCSDAEVSVDVVVFANKKIA